MAYIGNNLDSDIQVNKYEYTATAGQTTFACTYDRAVDVYLNGVKLDSSDFTATNGTAVVLSSGANAGDIVDINAYFDVTYFNIDNVLPDQTGHSGKFLTTDGTNSSWGTVDLTQFAAPVQLKNYTTTERNSLTGLDSGDTIFNSTTGSIEFYDGSSWIATNLIPTINSISGTIYAGSAGTLTLSVSNATDSIDVKYYEGGMLLATDANVTVTSGSATSTIPAAVYGQSAGDTISIQIFNQDGTPSSNSVNKTVIGLPTGGTITTVGSYRVHTFTSSGSFVIPSGFSANLDALIVAGGGAGAPYLGGGGGAGGMIVQTGITGISGTNTITIGAGATGTTDSSNSSSVTYNSGSNTLALGYTAIGGGAGGARYGVGQSGGSGGGGGGSGSGAGGSGTSGQGNRGGNSVNGSYQNAGGGGGAGAQGTDGTSGGTSPHGGVGAQNNYDGNNYYYAAGGGGALHADPYRAGNGGTGGGGGAGQYTPYGPEYGYGGGTARNSGSNGYGNGGNAGANTGSGGGAGGWQSGGSTGGSGGSGIVIIRYQL